MQWLQSMLENVIAKKIRPFVEQDIYHLPPLHYFHMTFYVQSPLAISEHHSGTSAAVFPQLFFFFFFEV